MDYELVELQPRHKVQVMNIFNGYVESSFAAYFSTCLPLDSFEMLRSACRGLPALAVETAGGEAVGFGMLKPFHPGDAVRQTGELSYFLAPEHTGKGLGRRLLGRLEEEAGRRGITNVIASVSSLNEPSLRFHLQNGFREAGRLLSAGRKFDRDFDIVLFQKRL